AVDTRVLDGQDFLRDLSGSGEGIEIMAAAVAAGVAVGRNRELCGIFHREKLLLIFVHEQRVVNEAVVSYPNFEAARAVHGIAVVVVKSAQCHLHLGAFYRTRRCEVASRSSAPETDKGRVPNEHGLCLQRCQRHEGIVKGAVADSDPAGLVIRETAHYATALEALSESARVDEHVAALGHAER